MRYRSTDITPDSDPAFLDEIVGDFHVVTRPSLKSYDRGSRTETPDPIDCQQVTLKAEPSGKTFTAWVDPDGPEWPLDFPELMVGDQVRGVLTNLDNGWEFRQVGLSPQHLDDWMRTTYRLARAVSHLLADANDRESIDR